jgi:hypothetical protein
LDDARQTIQLLNDAPVASAQQGLALQLLTAWSEAGPRQKGKLCSLGVAPALGQLAVQAVVLGDSGRDLQGDVCRWVSVSDTDCRLLVTFCMTAWAADVCRLSLKLCKEAGSLLHMTPPSPSQNNAACYRGCRCILQATAPAACGALHSNRR